MQRYMCTLGLQADWQNYELQYSYLFFGEERINHLHKNLALKPF